MRPAEMNLACVSSANATHVGRCTAGQGCIAGQAYLARRVQGAGAREVSEPLLLPLCCRAHTPLLAPLSSSHVRPRGPTSYTRLCKTSCIPPPSHPPPITYLCSASSELSFVAAAAATSAPPLAPHEPHVIHPHPHLVHIFVQRVIVVLLLLLLLHLLLHLHRAVTVHLGNADLFRQPVAQRQGGGGWRPRGQGTERLVEWLSLPHCGREGRADPGGPGDKNAECPDLSPSSTLCSPFSSAPCCAALPTPAMLRSPAAAAPSSQASS